MSPRHGERIALVTGGGSGIGRAVALRLVAAGFAVVVAGRRRDALDATVGEAVGPGRCRAVTADVRSAASLDRLFDEVLAWGGRLDLLVNNAGAIGAGAPVETLAEETWDDVLDVTLSGAFRCAQRAFRAMWSQDPQGGRIINNGSLSAHVPRPESIAYTAAKHGVTGLTRSLALEGRRFGIACGQIDVGNAATAMTAGMAHGALQADGTIAAEPTIDVGHVADAVLYMATLPLDVNVHAMTVMATAMPYVGRG